MVFNDGKIAGYQVKFRTNRTKPSYDESLVKILAEAQHTDYNYTIANCYSITNLVLKQQKHLQILLMSLNCLTGDFFENYISFTNELKDRTFFMLSAFQKQMIKDVSVGFGNNH